jgi:hypothetical protein
MGRLYLVHSHAAVNCGSYSFLGVMLAFRDPTWLALRRIFLVIRQHSATCFASVTAAVVIGTFTRSLVGFWWFCHMSLGESQNTTNRVSFAGPFCAVRRISNRCGRVCGQRPNTASSLATARCRPTHAKPASGAAFDLLLDKWSGRADLNRGPPAPKAGALPGCATPRLSFDLLPFDSTRFNYKSCDTGDLRGTPEKGGLLLSGALRL